MDSPKNPNNHDAIVRIIEKLCFMVKGKLKEEGLSACPGDFLADHAEEVMKHIQDPAIRALHVMYG
jgi:hypothetical protein